jgi:hypothetical protein
MHKLSLKGQRKIVLIPKATLIKTEVILNLTIQGYHLSQNIFTKVMYRKVSPKDDLIPVINFKVRHNSELR